MAAWVDEGEDALLYARHDEQTLDYFRSTAKAARQNWSSRARERYEHVRSKVIKAVDIDDFNRRLRAIGRKTVSMFRRDSVRLLTDIADLQHPPGEMMKFLLANPVVREKIKRNQCHGWSDRRDSRISEQDGEGHGNYWYRRATNGVFRRNDNGSYTANIYLDRLTDPDDKLSFEEQVDILHSWELLEGYLNAGDEDPTSKYNSKLT